MEKLIAFLALALAPPAVAGAAPQPQLAPAVEQWRDARQALGPLLMKEVNLELGRIRRDFPGQISRIYFEGRPPAQVVVLLKRESAVADRIVRIGGTFRIRMLEDAAAITQQEVEGRLQQQHRRIGALLPDLQGYSVDTAAGEVEMHVYAVGEDARRIRSRSAALASLIRYPVRIVPVAGRVSEQQG